jgi:hypothetical protein
MRNPLRTEAEAFRFLLAVIAGAIVIVAFAYANEWLGVAAAVLVVAGIVWWLRRPEPAEPPPASERLARPTPPGRHRILLVVPPDADADTVRERLRARVDGRETEVLVVVPALASPLEALSGAVDERREQARLAAEALAAQLAGGGLEARGTVGADEPLLATEDALREYGADEVVLVGDARLLEQARERLAVPVSLLD